MYRSFEEVYKNKSLFFYLFFAFLDRSKWYLLANLMIKRRDFFCVLIMQTH